MMLRVHCACLTGLVILLVTGANLQKVKADLIIVVHDFELSVGGSGSVNVSIESDASDNLDLFQYKFSITPDIGSLGILRFSDPQSDAEASLGNYIHAVDSGGFISQAQNGPAFDQMLGGDFTLSGNGTDLTTQKLLVSLDIEYVLPLGVQQSDILADSFVIALVQDTDTFFFSQSSNAVDVLSATSGRVTIIAVPEPSLLLLTAITLPIACLRQRRKVSICR